jgi:hypothetical protein
VSTDTDLKVLEEELRKRERPRSALYIGVHDLRGRDLVHRVWPGAPVDTLDKEDPVDMCSWVTHRVDLDCTRSRIIPVYDLCVCSYVLMYLRNPLQAIEWLADHARLLLIQENVVRERPNVDPWLDRNRFCSAEVACDPVASDRRLIHLPKVKLLSKYNNEGGVSALWEAVR